MNKLYSQNGDEIVINKYLLKNPDTELGTYVDIGACNPTFLSNTMYYYKRGWKGLEVDSYPKTRNLFEQIRPRDTFVEAAITDYDGRCMMNGRAVSDSLVGERYLRQYGTKEVFEIECMTINTLIARYSEFKEPDFLSIDIESNEEKALKCCDFTVFKPRIICIEFPCEGVDHRKLWEKYILPYYDFKEILVNNAFYLRKNE